MERYRQRQCDVFNVMKLSIIKFKHAIRKCKQDKETIIADSIAKKMCKKDHRTEINHHTNSKVTFPRALKVSKAM